jgi:8-oxo-dGTP pyrophosphatase MutT (NUDIX family)
MLQFLDAHEDCFERSRLVGHFCGSCWLENCDGTKFLLTLHGKHKRWTPLGGHADGDSDILRVAMREAREESGLEHIDLVSDEIFDIG